jgi:hypothetical protein
LLPGCGPRPMPAGTSAASKVPMVARVCGTRWDCWRNGLGVITGWGNHGRAIEGSTGTPHAQQEK